MGGYLFFELGQFRCAWTVKPLDHAEEMSSCVFRHWRQNRQGLERLFHVFLLLSFLNRLQDNRLFTRCVNVALRNEPCELFEADAVRTSNLLHSFHCKVLHTVVVPLVPNECWGSTLQHPGKMSQAFTELFEAMSEQCNVELLVTNCIVDVEGDRFLVIQKLHNKLAGQLAVE